MECIIPKNSASNFSGSVAKWQPQRLQEMRARPAGQPNGQGRGRVARLGRLQVLLRKGHQAWHNPRRGLGLLVRHRYVAGPGAQPASVHAAHRDACALLRLAIHHAAPVHQRRVVSVHLQMAGRGEALPGWQAGSKGATALCSLAMRTQGSSGAPYLVSSAF